MSMTRAPAMGSLRAEVATLRGEVPVRRDGSRSGTNSPN
jgi:hypothetical protein